MRILALVTDAFGGGGGIAQYNRDLLCALAKLDRVQRITVLPRTGQASQPDPKITQTGGKRGRLAYTAKAIRTARLSTPDLVFCGHLYLLPLCWLIAQWQQVPLWLQLHGIDAWQRPNSIVGDMLRTAALVTSVSRYTRRRFLAWAPITQGRVRVLPNTVAEEFIPGDRDLSRQELGYADNTLLLTVGRLAASERYKGHERVLRCIPDLLGKVANLRYVVAGDGDDIHRLRQCAKDLGVEQQVEFLGKVSFERLKILYRAADLFVMPSTGEGFGIVFLEAMASGTPALGLDCGGSRDPLRDGDLGYLTSEESLCDTLADVLTQPGKTRHGGVVSVGAPLRGATGAALSRQVRAIFGRPSFEDQVALLLDRLAAHGTNRSDSAATSARASRSG